MTQAALNIAPDVLDSSAIAALTGVSERAVRKRAARESWPHTETCVRGGCRKDFPVDTLPEDIRRLYYKEQLQPTHSPAPHAQPASLPTTPPQSATEPLGQRQINKALAKADLLRIYMGRMRQAQYGQKARARRDFMTAYNSGIAYPTLFEKLGAVSWKTIEGWKRDVASAKGETLQLADRRGAWCRGQSLISEQQGQILLKIALHPNRRKIAEVVRRAKAVMGEMGIENGYSEATYRRWLRDWKSHNHHIWVFTRRGAKAWNDECAYYIERDYALINVGDIAVADGHALNFEILNPWTGKPKRMTLIVWQDMKSSYPLGWEIMPTENTQAIASALRRAILRLGKIPAVAYLDNGRAFKSRFFKNSDLSQSGISGAFERLGMKTIFAWPYHGQSKTVERFFGTFAELERFCPTYSGTSIAKKPPRMMRGERLHRRVYEKIMGGEALTMAQAHMAIAAWFDEYVQRPQAGHLDGRAPAELFEAEKGPGVDPDELRLLMMSVEIRRIHRNGISLLGRNYYHPALYGRRHPVTVRYDLQDKTAVHVFTRDGEYLCTAPATEKAHPAATTLGTDADRERLAWHIEHKKLQEKSASSVACEFLEKEVLPEHRRQLAAIGIEAGQAKLLPVKKKSLPAPLTPADEQQIMAEAEANLAESTEATATDQRTRLEAMSEIDRYEAILEMEAQGHLITKQWRAFLRYYETTPEFESARDYWEERRVVFATMYQTNTMEEAAT